MTSVELLAIPGIYETLQEELNNEVIEQFEEETMYMNIQTGVVDNYDGWFYNNEEGEEVNAVDLDEVVEVVEVNDQWTEVNKPAIDWYQPSKKQSLSWIGIKNDNPNKV
jgi:hypothetical protein